IALPIFEALVVFDRKSSYDAQTLGALYLQLGQADKAIVQLDRALKLETDHAPTLLNYTKALLMVGRTDEALKLAELLTKEANPMVSNMAKALLLAYGE